MRFLVDERDDEWADVVVKIIDADTEMGDVCVEHVASLPKLGLFVCVHKKPDLKGGQANGGRCVGGRGSGAV